MRPDKGIHLIKAQTALGKTTAYIKLILNNPEKKFLIALPTNILKQQVADDLNLKGLRDEEIYVTESVQDNLLFPVELRQTVIETHQRGFHNKTKKLVGEYYEEIKEDRNKKAVAEACLKILNGARGIKNERVVVTTHANFVQMSEEFLSHYTIIIDEDILQLQFFNRVSSVRVEVLEELVESGIPEYSKIAAEMCKATENEYVRIYQEYFKGMLEVYMYSEKKARYEGQLI